MVLPRDTPNDLPLVSAEILLGCDEAAEELGIDLEPLMRQHDIDPALLGNPVGYLDHARVTRFFQSVESSLGMDAFGFVLGRHQPSLRLGPIGEVMMASGTLGEALAHGMQLQPIYSEGSTHELVVRDGVVQLSRWNTESYDFATTQMRMLGIVMMFKIVTTLGGQGWRPSSVSCSFRKTSQAKQMVRYFGCPVLFDQGADAIHFPEEDLNRALPSANVERLLLLKKQLMPLVADTDAPRSVLKHAESYIRQTVGTGRCRMESCCQLLRITPRTLQRELAAQGTSFRSLLLQIRLGLACQLLRDSTLDLAQLSKLLGYNGQSAFTRAFKGALGVAPSEWRRAHVRHKS